MKLPFQDPSHGAPHHRPAQCAQLDPEPAVRCRSRLKISPLPQANYNETYPAFLFTNFSICSRSLSPKTNAIESA
jgi:hypothetical protein